MARRCWVGVAAMVGLLMASSCQVVAGLTDLQFDEPIACVEGGPGPIAYVRETAAGAATGVSWANAFNRLDTALSYAAGCSEVSEIWVAAGRYTPGADGTSAFRLVDGVSVYGGFAGDENMLADRDWTQNVTILSGDLGNDDTLAQGVVLSPDDINGDNSDHVVAAADIAGAALLDGFTITGGQATTANGIAGDGGGVLLSNANVTLQNITLRGNHAEGLGGALSASGGTLTLHNVSAIANRATDGGGIAIRDGAMAATLLALNDNEASGRGGALFAQGAMLSVRDALLSENRAGLDGGAGYHLDTTADYLRVQLRGNEAIGAGGAVAQQGGALSYEDVLLSGNAAGTQGGAAFSNDTVLRWTNITAAGNRSAGLGGALYHEMIVEPVIVANAILWNNQDMTGAGGPTAAISNFGAAVQVSTSIVESSLDAGQWQDGVGQDMGGNLDVDPLFREAIEPDQAPSSDGDLRIGYRSEAIDAGSPEHVVELTDLLNNPRPGYLGIDIGAYELYAPCLDTSVVYVRATASGTDFGDSWTDAFPSIQRAIFHAERCAATTEIWVARGVYKPGTDRDATYLMRSGLALYGGFAGTETALQERDPALNPTVLSGDIDNDDIVDADGVTQDADDIAGSNSRHLVSAPTATIDASALLDGFVLTGGDARGPGDDDHGSAILIRGATPSFANLLIIGNTGIQGGAIRCDDGGLSMRASAVRNNTAGTGAGIRASDCNGMTFTDVDFVNNRVEGFSSGGAAFLQNVLDLTVTGGVWGSNSASNVGGAVRVRDASTTSWRNVIFRGNSGEVGQAPGAAVSLYLGSHRFENVLFSGNYHPVQPGGALGWTSGNNTLQIINCTFSGNRAANGGALFFNLDTGAQATLFNSILWNNADGNDAADTLADAIVLNGNPALLQVQSSLVQYAGASGPGWNAAAGVDGGGNVSFDPQFVTPAAPGAAPTADGDYHLSIAPQSPAIGVGDNALVSPDNTTDLDGNPRILGTIDLGPYESQ